MKRNIVLMLAGLIVAPVTVTAAPVCVHTGTYIATLNKDDTTASNPRVDEMDRWVVSVGYDVHGVDRVIYGRAMCHDYVGSYATALTALDEEMDDEGGANCWCRMTYPLSSYWMYLDDSCGNCVKRCADAFVSDKTWRDNMIDAIW